MTTWQVQSAKQRFSEVVRAAQAGQPQFITKHGEPVAVLLDIEEYRRTHTVRPSLAQFLRAAPDLSGLELPARTADGDRARGLFAPR